MNMNHSLVSLKKFRKSKLIFKISSLAEAEELWEPLIDFTKIKKGGVALKQLLIRLK